MHPLTLQHQSFPFPCLGGGTDPSTLAGEGAQLTDLAQSHASCLVWGKAGGEGWGAAQGLFSDGTFLTQHLGASGL